MRTSFMWTLVLGSLSATGQNLHDPYADHTGTTFPIAAIASPGLSSAYDGEYMVFPASIFWSEIMDAGTAGHLILKVEAVSFPFTPPPDPETQVGERILILPEFETYGYQPPPGHCSGWSWESYQTPSKRLMRVHQGQIDDLGNNGPTSWKATLTSDKFQSGGIAVSNCLDPGRTELPHTVLKHTLYYQHLDGGDAIIVDSISWISDHTRGRMKFYPFCENNSTTSEPSHYDVTFRPWIHFDPNGHNYAASTNGNWVTTLPSGTSNYFATPPSTWVSGARLYPDPADLATHEFLNSPDNDLVIHPPPYSLLECPVLNSTGTNFAGYDPAGTLVANGGNSGIGHHYVIDKPIDLRLINPVEKIIYNPSDVDVAIAGAYTGQPLIFPGGYTFKTVHGIHPSRNSVSAFDPLGLHPDPLLAPLPSTLGANSSVYRIKSGSHLIIEPCATILDAQIIVEAGGTLSYKAADTYGNFTVVNAGGTINSTYGMLPVKPCLSECYIPGNYDVKDWEVGSSQTWSAGSLPPDGNLDGQAVIMGTLTVGTGAVLEIGPGVELLFGPHGRMIIQRGARVEAEGVTFSSACNNMWPGIEVWGTTDGDQYPLSGNTIQGVFIAEDCTFENARTAVLVGRSFDLDEAFSGGVFRTSFGTFKNNGLDIDIKPTRNMHSGAEVSNRCYIGYNEFITEGNLIDPVYLNTYAQPRGPVHHVRLTEVKGIQISYNDFSNTPPAGATYLPHERGTGVFARGCVFTAAHNQFSGFSEAIWHVSIASPNSVIATARFRFNSITNTLHGIVTDGTELDEFWGNTIDLPPSPAYDYSIDDLNAGYDTPIGIYTQESVRMHIEDNTITGSAVDASDPHLTYGMVINQSNDAGHEESNSLIHLNSIDGVNIAIQCEGDNRGDYAPAPATTSGGLLIECNEFGQINDVKNYDVAIASNLGSGFYYDGLLRDQGECDLISSDRQAANKFSTCTAAPSEEHWYFDDHSLDVNPDFKYSDIAGEIPTCENIPTVDPCFIPISRDCQPIAGDPGPLRAEKLGDSVTRIAQLIDSLDATMDSLARLGILSELSHEKTRRNLYRNDLARWVIENEPMDSLVALLSDTSNGAGLEELIAAHIERGDLAIADSLIEVLIEREGLEASAQTLLLQLQVALRAANEQPSEEQLALLDSLVQADPLGAWTPKATLAFLRGIPYKRIPWMLNDTIAGWRFTMHSPGKVSDLKAIPNPCDAWVDVIADDDVKAVYCFNADGRLVANITDIHGTVFRLNTALLAGGTYFLRVETSTGARSLPLAVIH